MMDHPKRIYMQIMKQSAIAAVLSLTLVLLSKESKKIDRVKLNEKERIS